MARNITITFGDGSSHVYQNAPDDITPDAVQARAEKEFSKPVKGIDGGAKPQMDNKPADEPWQAGVGRGVLNAGAGALRGAGSIGATLLAPYDMAVDYVKGDRGKNLSSLITGQELPSRNQERRAAMDAGLQTMGADTDSLAYGGGKIAAEIAGTAGVGGVAGNTIAGLAGLAGYGAKAAPLVQALRTSGMSTGGGMGVVKDLALRTGAGAAAGGASAGMIDPADAKTGAVIGGTLPGAMKVVGAAGGWVGSKLWDMLTPDIQNKALQLVKMTGKSLDEVMTALRQQGPTLIPGSEKTVPQILQDPHVSQVARTLKSSGQYELGAREAANSAAQIQALERIAPTVGTINEARANLGGAVERAVRPAEKAAGASVNRLFDAIPSDQAVIQLPLDQMRAAQARFLGPGTFGKGAGPVDAALDEATAIGTRAAPRPVADYSSSDLSRRASGGHGRAEAGPTVPQAVPFDQLQKLRSSIGEAIEDAKKNGRNQAKAALTTMKNAIDNKVADVASGNLQAGEAFTPEAIDAWGQALNAHAAKKLQFNTGPQAAIFRMGQDGLPSREGAEIAPLFWNSGNAQIESMQAFKRLTKEDQALVSLMKSNATTEALNQGAKGPSGALTFDAFNKWMKTHSGAARELFTDSEMATLKAIQGQTRDAAASDALGSAKGSPTFQNFYSNGTLDNPLLNVAANKIPFGKVALTALKGANEKSRNEILSKLLADPSEMVKALEASGVRGEAKNKILQLMNTPDGQKTLQMLYRAAPATSDR
jgi:hypothetical protein